MEREREREREREGADVIYGNDTRDPELERRGESPTDLEDAPPVRGVRFLNGLGRDGEDASVEDQHVPFPNLFRYLTDSGGVRDISRVRRHGDGREVFLELFRGFGQGGLRAAEQDKVRSPRGRVGSGDLGSEAAAPAGDDDCFVGDGELGPGGRNGVVAGIVVGFGERGEWGFHLGHFGRAQGVCKAVQLKMGIGIATSFCIIQPDRRSIRANAEP